MIPPGMTHRCASRSGVSQGTRRTLRTCLLHRIWLPASLYRAIPWIYIVNGSACLAGALYLPDQAWLWPYIVLLGLSCFHAAFLALRARRSRQAPNHPTSPGPAPLMPESPGRR